MAKRHHSSRRSEGAGHHREMHNDERRTQQDRGVIGNFKHHDYYAGQESRRRMEMEDAGMIHEDHRAIANMPQEVMIKPYPRTGPYLPEGIDDTIRGVDHQMDYDDSQRARNFYPKKV
jgi:hypothetical protein